MLDPLLAGFWILSFDQTQVRFFCNSPSEVKILCQAAAPPALNATLLREIGITRVREFLLKIFASGADSEFGNREHLRILRTERSGVQSRVEKSQVRRLAPSTPADPCEE